MNQTDKKKLDDYLKKWLGITSEKIIGHVAEVKKDIRVILLAEYSVVIKKGTKIKIQSFGENSVQPLGYSNFLYFEIVNPQVELPSDLKHFKSGMEELINVL